MAFTNSLNVTVGNPTKANDYNNLADNTEFNREKANAEHNFDISTGDGTHTDITADTITMAGTVDMSAFELILDADGDSSITADTDDQIDIRVAASDRVIIKGAATSTTPTLQAKGSNSGGTVQCINVYNTGTAATGTSPRIGFSANRTTGGETLVATIEGEITDIGNASYDGNLVVKLAIAGATPAEVLRITEAGQMGLNTDTPAGDLHIHQTSGVVELYITSDGSSSNTGIWFAHNYAATADYAGIRFNATNNILEIFNANSARQDFGIDANKNVMVGSAALATTATDGFLYIPTCPGIPTGTPTTHSGLAPLVIDSTNNDLYFYSGGSWRNAGP